MINKQVKEQNTIEDFNEDKLICKKCKQKVSMQTAFELQQNYYNNKGNTKRWYKWGVKYGFLCLKCHNLFNQKEKEAILK